MPLGRQPAIEKKVADPSSSPRGEKYPIPSLFGYRAQAQEIDFYS
jgi:hypothetical protein